MVAIMSVVLMSSLASTVSGLAEEGIPPQNTCLASIVNGIPQENPGVELGMTRQEELPADQSERMEVRLSLWNVGTQPVYVSPGMGELGGCLRIMARRAGSSGRAVMLFNQEHAFRYHTSEDLFALMPHRALQNTVQFEYHPIFTGEGSIEMWAEFDCREMARSDQRALAIFLKSAPVVTRVKKRR